MVAERTVPELSPGRFPAMTLTAGGLFLDFSKNFLTKETLLLLLELAKECDLEKIRDRMFEGDKINTTEHRAVLHTALRAPRYEKVLVDGKNVPFPTFRPFLIKCAVFSEKIHSGEWKGFTGKPITDIVNIGMGGSDVGPRMVCQAMRSFHIKELNVHFVANVDGHDLDMVLKKEQGPSGNDSFHHCVKNLYDTGNHAECPFSPQLVSEPWNHSGYPKAFHRHFNQPGSR